MRPIAGAGAAVRVTDGNHMAIQMDRLAVVENERLQEFLLPLIPNEYFAERAASSVPLLFRILD
jgi:hypothetical protein